MAINSTDASKVKLEAMKEGRLDPFAFFTGRVVQTFSKDASSIEAADLSSYIDRGAKTIRSVTDQLNWNYDKGILKVETPECQGVIGFIGGEGFVELKNLKVRAENDYITIVAIALDGKPLEASDRILVQTMTEDRLYGWRTEGNIIKSTGEYPINVKDIHAEVILKGCSVDTISKLDANGYVVSSDKAVSKDDGIYIKLDKDSIYTVLSRGALKSNAGAAVTGTAEWIWWEGEDTIETNFPAHTSISGDTLGNKRDLLSGGDWLTNEGKREPGQEEPFAKYKVTVAKKGEYNFWVRKFWHHGPFRWRFDEDEWSICPFSCGLADSVSLNDTGACANWVNLGKVSLDAGEHTFELRMLAEEGESLESGFDSFLLTTGFFAPRGKYKPGERSGKADEGYWAFEPEVDSFGESPIDLRYLNEEIAGQSGFVKTDGFDFVLGDGRKVKFWAVNVGGGIVSQSKSAVDYLARRLAKAGVNMVRLHGGLFKGRGNDLSQVDMEYLDKYHYFIAAMKKQGIYVKLSYYFPLWVNMKPAFGIPGYEGDFEGKHPFALFQFNEKFQEYYKEWSRKILLTVNPYTGLPLAKDPAVAIIEVQNEDNYLFWTFGRRNIPEVQMEVLEKIFGSWLIKKYGSLEKAKETWGEGSEKEKDDLASGRMMILDIGNCTSHGHGEGAHRRRMADQLQFLVEHQKEFYEKMVDFFRNEIGSESLISASNWTTADSRLLDPLERYTYTAGDVIDRHGYFEEGHKGDRAAWSVREGHEFVNLTALKAPEKAIVQINQVENYPHMITETAWPMPNRFKGEAIPMWTIYGALQGMDAIYMFALGSVDWETNPISKWPLMVPSVFGQFPAFALMYRRGDVKEAPTVVRVTHKLDELYNFKGAPIYERQALDELRKADKK